MYPLGVACPDGECRNSITGKCTADCSESICNEDVPAGMLCFNYLFVSVDGYIEPLLVKQMRQSKRLTKS